MKVAVAGGTGGLGLHIIEAILAAKKHNVVVLSRSSSSPPLETLGVQVFKVDYDNHSSLVSALEGVHTVISIIRSLENMAGSQIALLNAAVEAGVKRFAPSEFSIRSLPDDTLEYYRRKTPVVDALAKSGLEWTVFEPGLFMNYFAVGTKGIGYMTERTIVVDIRNRTARVPNTGNEKTMFTALEDVGAFVAASLDLEKWPERSGMAGDTKTYNEVIALAEEVTGKKFSVTYVTEAELRQEMNPDPPSIVTNFWQQLPIVLGYEPRFRFEPNLNELCPEVKPIGVREFLQKWWGSTK